MAIESKFNKLATSLRKDNDLVVWILYLTRCKGCVSFKTNQRQKNHCIEKKTNEQTCKQNKENEIKKTVALNEPCVSEYIPRSTGGPRNTSGRKPTWRSFFVSVESVSSVVLYWVTNLIIVFFYSSQWRTCWVLTWIKGQLTFSWKPPSVKFLHR